MQVQGRPTAIDGLSGAQSILFTRLHLAARQSSELRLRAQDYFGCVCLCCVCRNLGESLPVFLRASHGSSSSSWIFACLLPQRKKKGHVCLEKYVGQWNISCTGAKGEEGSGGGGVREWSSSALLATAPHPRASAGRGPLSWVFPSLTHFPDLLCSPWKKHRLFLPSSFCHRTRNSALQHPPRPRRLTCPLGPLPLLLEKLQRSELRRAGERDLAPSADLPHVEGTTVACSPPTDRTAEWQLARRGSALGREGRFLATRSDNLNGTFAGSPASPRLPSQPSSSLSTHTSPPPSLSRV